MRDRRIGLVVAIVVVAMAGVGVAMAATRSTSAKSGTVMAAKVGKYGTVLVAANGRTLYRYTPDKKNVSTATARARPTGRRCSSRERRSRRPAPASRRACSA